MTREGREASPSWEREPEPLPDRWSEQVPVRHPTNGAEPAPLTYLHHPSQHLRDRPGPRRARARKPRTTPYRSPYPLKTKGEQSDDTR